MNTYLPPTIKTSVSGSPDTGWSVLRALYLLALAAICFTTTAVAQPPSISNTVDRQEVLSYEFESQLLRHRAQKRAFLEKLRRFAEIDFSDHARFAELFLIEVVRLKPDDQFGHPRFRAESGPLILGAYWGRMTTEVVGQYSPWLSLRFSEIHQRVPLTSFPEDPTKECVLDREFLDIFSAPGWTYQDTVGRNHGEVWTTRNFSYQRPMGRGKVRVQADVSRCVDQALFSLSG